MIKVYLFDWGDTLMVDFPNESGKMCDWERVEAISGAEETLAELSKNAQIYIATGAAESSELDIKLAFQRVGLNKFISGYFCEANLGSQKGSPAFLNTIIARLNKPTPTITMVGDNFEKDIKPALAVGINAIWFTQNNSEQLMNNVRVIKSLSELCA